MNITRGALEHLRYNLATYGVSNVARIYAARFLGHPKTIAVRPVGFSHTVRLRIRTTDFPTYQEVILDKHYGFELPFTPEAIVDAGANIGLASVFFANRFPKAHIIAVEPELSNFKMLVDNARPYPNITPVRAALWSFDGEVGIGDSAMSGSGHWAFTVRETSLTRVPAVTLHNLMRLHNLSRIDLLKVDIEGAEKEVFEADDFMGVVRCLMIETHDRFKPGCSNAVRSRTNGFAALQGPSATELYLRTNEM